MLMLDIDLISLSDPWERFKLNSRNIRKEYQPIIDIHGMAVFLDGREKFLQAMLDKPCIYYTEKYKDLESMARRNLLLEIEAIEDERIYLHID